MIVIAVPYLMPFHPSPNDYFRFSRQALERMLSDAGFTNVSITALGSGVFAARFLLLERLFPGNIQRIIGPVLHPLVRVLDAVVASIARDMNKKYSIEDYALGFVVTAYA